MNINHRWSEIAKLLQRTEVLILYDKFLKRCRSRFSRFKYRQGHMDTGFVSGYHVLAKIEELYRDPILRVARQGQDSKQKTCMGEEIQRLKF
jgi:hypothetical protein